jgi:hypothetical protein
MLPSRLEDLAFRSTGLLEEELPTTVDLSSTRLEELMMMMTCTLKSIV